MHTNGVPRDGMLFLILLIGVSLICFAAFPLSLGAAGEVVVIEAVVLETQDGGAMAEISFGSNPGGVVAGYLELNYDAGLFATPVVIGGKLLDGALMESNVGEPGVIRAAWVDPAGAGKKNARGILLNIIFQGIKDQPLELKFSKVDLKRADGSLVPFQVKGEGQKAGGVEIELQIGSHRALVNGSPRDLSAAPFLQKGRTMVPLRFISEHLGAEVAWLMETSQVEIRNDRQDIMLTIDSSSALVNGVEKDLDCPALLRNGATYVPLRFVGAILGVEFAWDDATQKIDILH